MSRLRSFSVRVSVLVTGAFIALLVFASGAAAATVTGETSVVESQKGTPSPEFSLVKASVSYEPTGGNVAVNVTTGGAPQETAEGELQVLLMSVEGRCSWTSSMKSSKKNRAPRSFPPCSPSSPTTTNRTPR
jgi:hypothetical protein